MYRLSQAHSKVMVLQAFLEGIVEIEKAETQNLDKNQTCFPDEGNSCSQILRNLFLLLALYWIDEDGKDFLELGLISVDEVIQGNENRTNESFSLMSVRRALTELSSKYIRPHCLALVDAFDWSDMQLHHSALGSYEGNVYERLIKRSKEEPLNQLEPITTLFSNTNRDQQVFTQSNL